MNPNKRAATKLEQMKRAQMIKGTLGAYRAARYLRNCGWHFEGAVYTLLGPRAVDRIPEPDDKYSPAPLGAQE